MCNSKKVMGFILCSQKTQFLRHSNSSAAELHNCSSDFAWDDSEAWDSIMPVTVQKT